MRGPGADSVPGARLNDISAPAQEFGVVGYTHAGGVDRPLVVWKGMGATPSEVVVPHANWRGVYGKGTTSSGATSTVAIEWPGFKTTAYHSMGPSQQSTTNWMGSLIGGQRDPGGTMYMRNRYYDPATGQFTQTDPIGIAGGLNTYGFAAGDPVAYRDPFGLKVCANARHLRRAIERAANATIEWDTSNCVSDLDQVTYHGGGAWTEIQEQFSTFVTASHTYNVNRGVSGKENPMGCNPGCSWYEYETRTAWIFDEDFSRIEDGVFRPGIRYKKCGWFSLGPRYTAAGVVLHELFGHGQFDGPLLATHSNGRSFEYENQYNRIQGRPERCY